MAFKDDFRPDIIAGNPPYNNGMDIDFVFNAFEVAKVAVAKVTPAKFQTADADQNIVSKHSYGDMRQKITPHIKELIYYPQSRNIFNIYQIDGIAIYLINPNKEFELATVTNRCLEQKLCNSISIRSIRNRETLYNIGIDIVHKLDSIEKFQFNYDINKRYQVWTNTQVAASGGKFMNSSGKTAVIGVSRIIDTYKNEQSSSTKSKCIFSADSIEECKSFISWLNTKLVRFLVGINTSKLTGILTDDTFRFVPKPKEFDHIYTDSEMIDTYDLKEYEYILNEIISEKSE